MGTKKPTLTVILLLIVLSIYSQSENIDIVKRYYPQIYTSIKTEAEKQWANDPKVSNAIMEGQAKAFLQIAESKVEIDPVAMGDALLYGSLTNEEEYNRTILDDLRVENPYTLLRCNWSIVRTRYEETKNIKLPYNDPVIDDPNTTKPKSNDKYQDEIYGKEVTKRIKKEKDISIITKERKFYASGVGLGCGLSTMSNLNNWGENANPGIITEVRAWTKIPNNSETFFWLWELSVNYIHHSLYVPAYSENSSINQLNIGTRIIPGYRKNLSSTTSLSIGLGGFLTYNLLSNENKYEKEKNGKPTSNFLKDMNGGLSALVAFEKNRYEFAIIPDWGITEFSRNGTELKTFNITLSVSYLF